MNRIAPLAAILSWVIAPASLADVINVPADQPTIQDAINAAQNGDEVVLAPGFYNEPIRPNGKAITIRSTDPEDDAVVYATEVGEIFERAVVFENGEGPDTVLAGLYLNFNSPEDYVNDPGGAILCDGTSPTITRCFFINNDALRGGVLAAINDASPNLDRCMIYGNNGGFGVAVNVDGASARITNSLLYMNATNGSANDSVIDVTNGTLGIHNCTIMDNDHGGGSGIGIYARDDAEITITNSIVLGNAICDPSFESCFDLRAAMTNASLTAQSCVVGRTFGPVMQIATVSGTVLLDSDYRQLPGSVTIDAGEGTLVPADAMLDFDGNPRISGGSVDVGAFESQAADLCTGDCDDSGTVDFNDLVAMLFQFGNDTQDGCDADDNGTVNFNDLVAALFLFGPCD